MFTEIKVPAGSETSPPDTECTSRNGDVYESTTGAQFDIYCTTTFSYNDLYINYTIDFLSCIDGCATWNAVPGNTPCVGVSYAPGNYGPDISQSQCYYKWALANEQSYSLTDSAVLVSGVENTTVAILHVRY